MRSLPARPSRIGVLADDLTGAGDVAAAFLAAGFRPEISILPVSGRAAPPHGADVWIVDTESRALPAPAARRLVRRAVRRLRAWGARFLYKKIDSTLRGPLGAEAAAFAAAVKKEILFVPAFPRMGRHTRRGRQYVRGAPLQRTAFARDPRDPVRTSSIEDRLRRTGARAAELGFLRVPDVPDQQTLRRLARQAARDGAAAGSAGLVEEIARLWRRPLRKVRRRNPPAGDVLVLVGSAHPAAKRQAAEALRLLRARPVSVGSSEEHLTEPLNSARKLKTSRLFAPFFLLAAPPGRGDPTRIAEDLSARAARFMARRGIRRVAATGGETAFRLARRLGLFRLKVVRRLDRGVCLCRSAGGENIWLALKPGGFGGRGALARMARELRTC